MAPLPKARARIHGVAGGAVRAGAVARHAVRRTGAAAVAAAKVVLWLSVVVASLVAIGSLGRAGRPRYSNIEALQRQTFERDQRAFQESLRASAYLDQVIREQAHAASRDVLPPTGPRPVAPTRTHHHR